MTRSEKDELVEVIMRIKSELDITQVIIEHDVQMISECCHMSAFLNFGVVIAEGETSAVVRDSDVRAAYIGHMAEEG
jgi:branched-chain amino acid transport system ATP-binding protein